MKRQFHTSAGVVERELTDAEVQQLAAEGNIAAKREIAKKKLAIALTPSDKINVILEYLGLTAAGGE